MRKTTMFTSISQVQSVEVRNDCFERSECKNEVEIMVYNLFYSSRNMLFVNFVCLINIFLSFVGFNFYVRLYYSDLVVTVGVL